MSNAYFYISAGATSPALEAALIDADGYLVNLQGADVQFGFYNLGGGLRFRTAAEVVNEDEGHVRYAWGPGEVPSVAGRYLARFEVTYSNFDEQNFPSDRYIEVVVT